ncbi:MAG: TetR/AcrR family transcriptional regulator [Candidatus Eiseniibacteriota bacterium]
MNELGVAPTRKGEETKARILAAATELIHQKGFKNTGLQEILDASGVPKGSFYFYFKSKEDLGRELLYRYRLFVREELTRSVFTGTGDAIPQVQAFFRQAIQYQTDGGCKRGCLLGNFAAETTDVHEDIRRELVACFDDLKQLIADALARGQRDGELADDFSPGVAGGFLLSMLEGTILLAKAVRGPGAFSDCETMLTRYLDTLRRKDVPAGSGAREGGQS